MTEARTTPPIREGLARAISASPAWPAVFEPGASLAAADAALSYLHSRHLLNDIALSNIKDEEAK